jgi:hypothetical protein
MDINTEIQAIKAHLDLLAEWTAKVQALGAPPVVVQKMIASLIQGLGPYAVPAAPADPTQPFPPVA